LNQIAKLISAYCPNGVPTVRLDSIVQISNRGVNKVDTPGESEVFLLNYMDVYRNRELTGLQVTSKTTATSSQVIECDLQVGDIFITPTSETRDDIAHAAVVISPMLNTVYSYHLMRMRIFNLSEVEPKFLAYQFRSPKIQAQIVNASNGITRFGLTKPKWESLLIQLPPIKVQREIIRILDKFTELDAELVAELEVRELQIQHYARAMTEIFSKHELSTLKLSEFAEIGTGSRNTQDAIEGAKYPFYVRSQIPLSIDQFEFDEQAVLTAGDGVGVGKVFHFANGKYALHQRAYRVKPDESIVDPKFLYYYMKNNFGLYLESTAVHASVTSLRRPMFEKFEVTFPSIASQRKIVYFLDLIEAFIGDQNIGLIGEINLRRKQYEYYRSKLLTFKELDVA
jgi:type I restriction enzyme S subunit